jgi:hypothetical protein
MKKWLFPVLSAVLLITVITHTELVRNYSERSCYVKGFHMGGTASGAKSGWGIYVYLDGSVYVGNFRHNQIHGQGTFYSSTGGRYVGEYKQGRMDGYGVYTYPDGTTRIVGEWSDDQLVKELKSI